MTVARTVTRNVSLLLAGYGVSQALRVVYIAVLARHIGTVGIGQIGTATALVSLLMILVGFGMSPLIVRQMAADHESAPTLLTSAVVVRLLLSLAFAVLLTVVILASPYPGDTRRIIAVYALAYVLDAFADLGRNVFTAYQRMEYRVSVDLMREVLNIGLSVLAMLAGWPLVVIVAMSAVASLAKLVVTGWLVTRRFFRPTLKVSRVASRTLLAAGVPFFLLALIGVGADRAGMLILSWFASADSVGLFTAGASLVAMVLVVPEMVMESVYPVFSKEHLLSGTELRSSYSVSYKALLLIGVPIGVATALIARPMVLLIFGDQFGEAGPVAVLLSVQLMTMVGYVNGAYLNATNRQKVFSAFRLGSLLILVVLCFLLTPRYGHLGTAAAIATSAVLDFSFYTAVCHHYSGAKMPWGTVLRALAGGLAMFLVGRTLEGGGLGVFSVGPGLAVYVAVLYLSGGISGEEWQFMKSLVPVRRAWRSVAGLIGR